MYQENYYKTKPNFSISSDFSSDRNNGRHEGIDYVSKLAKKQSIYNLFAGQVVHFGKSELSGNYVILKHNFKFIRGIDDYFFTAYRHLSEIDILVNFRHSATLRNNMIGPGEIIGKMGNTGNSLTFEKKKWRKLTDEEKENTKEKKGVHLHFEIFQFTSEYRNMTPLLQDLISRGLVIENDAFFYFIRQGCLYLRPDILDVYASILLLENN